MLCVVAPVDHKYPTPELDVSVTLPPAQKVVGPDAVMVGAGGNELTVTSVAAEGKLRHPLALVTLTV